MVVQLQHSQTVRTSLSCVFFTYCGNLAEHLIHCFGGAFKDHSSIRFDHVNWPRRKVQPAHVESTVELATLSGHVFMQGAALELRQFILGSAIVSAAARNEGQYAQPPHAGPQAEFSDPVHNPGAACNHSGLDRRGNVSTDEAANISGGVIEGFAADDGIVVLTVPMQADLYLRARRPKLCQQSIGDHNAVGSESCFRPSRAHVSKQLRKGRVNRGLASAEVDGLHPVCQEPVDALR